MSLRTVLALSLVATLAACDDEDEFANDTDQGGANVVTTDVALRDDLRKLWTDHVSWTRFFLMSAIADLPDVDTTTARLLQNQVDLGQQIVPFYGQQAGDDYGALLRTHILQAAGIVADAKAGDQAAVQADVDAWYDNADAIAAFLADLNPSWSEATLRDELHVHLALTLDEATARLEGDAAADIAAYDEGADHMLGFADLFAKGIEDDLPERIGDGGFTSSEEQIHLDQRRLWSEHVIWTRSWLISDVAVLPDTGDEAARLLRNQDDLGASFEPYYGAAAAEQIASLLRTHIEGAVALVDAAEAGDADAVAAANAAWHENADDISAALASLNPAWTFEDLSTMMTEHLDLTLAEATARLTGEYAQEVDDYDRVVDEILDMADTLSGGVVEQFPDRFGG